MTKWISVMSVACFCIGVVDCGDDSEKDPLDCAGGRYDESTNLCWQHPRVEGSFNCEQAIDYCLELDLAGHTDWVLPTYHDFTKLLGNCGIALGEGRGNCDSCELSDTCDELFGPDNGGYWSSTYYDDAHAWYFDFLYGDMDTYFVGDVHNRVRCVRSVP